MYLILLIVQDLVILYSKGRLYLLFDSVMLMLAFMEREHEDSALFYDDVNDGDGDDEVCLFADDYHHHYHLHFVVQVVLSKFYVVYNVWWCCCCS
jgi:hypothetical protein